MLVVTLKPNEIVYVGEVAVQIIKSGPKRTEIGFSGDRNIPIVREKAKKKFGQNQIQ
jgi:sRNA-binding carbon storage regulator CsrA